MLKEMLICLRSSLQSDTLSCVHQFRTELQDLGDRVNQVESSLVEYTSSFNTMIDAHEVQIEVRKLHG